MKRAPNEWTGYTLVKHINHGPREGRIGSRVEQPARPLGFYSLRSRARLAWAVFTGRADALFWIWLPTDAAKEEQ